jgi:hypothetical protein
VSGTPTPLISKLGLSGEELKNLGEGPIFYSLMTDCRLMLELIGL